MNVIYDFEIDEVVYPDYKVGHTVLTWLQGNLASITDDNTKPLFNRVNLGFNEDTIRNFTDKPICDVYLNNVDYKNDFDFNTPDNINSIIVISLRGKANNTYGKALQIQDYITQEFIENLNFRELDRIVSETRITNSRIEMNRENKILTTLIIFELNHVLI